jgi:serine/threonine protein phosphatase 1
MSGRVIAIGDIHGCLVALRSLIELIQPRPNDTLVTLGDYVDRGPDTRGVIDFLLDLKTRCHLVPLFGNHEEMMRQVVIERELPFDWLRHGGVDTLDSYKFVGDINVVPESHRNFLESLVDYYETDTHFFVHANYDPSLDLDKQPPEYLRWIKLTDTMPARHKSGKKAVVGHTHDREGAIVEIPHLICIDTYCYGGFWLTGLDVNSGEIWQVRPDGSQREPDDETTATAGVTGELT